MFFRYLLIFILFNVVASAQEPTDTITQPISNLKISILTCGSGDELYSTFGHSGIRITDIDEGIDIVYNYGIFDFYDPDFYKKFTLGTLLYYVGKSSFNNFIYEYEMDERYVKEQVLDINQKDAESIYDFLENNILPENKYYRYDFLNDNCATRIKNILPLTLDNSFLYGEATPQKITYRTALNNHLTSMHWARFGINLILGRPIDKKMNNDEAMFLPDYFYNGLKSAQYQGSALVKTENILVKDSRASARTLNGPLWLNIFIFFLTVLSFHNRKLRSVKKVLKFTLLFVSGLLGSFMLFMWMGSEHLQMSQNFNILWALPTNLFVSFLMFRKRNWMKYYALIAVLGILAALAIHLLNIQRLPLIELIPLLLSLLYIYSDFWKKD